MIAAFGLIAIWVIWVWLRKPSDQLGIKGELIWVDRGKDTKPFFNHYYKVLGKPDLMYKVDGGILAVEYKGRKNNIYDSDIVQGLTACLAARGQGYNVSRLLVKTDGSERSIDLPKSDKALYNKVSTQVELVRKAKLGQRLPAQPARFKCDHCAYTEACDKR